LKLRTKTLAYGLAGLAVAGLVIFSGSAAGLLNFSASGVLSVLLTDPPIIPAGVTAVFITYSDLAVHASGFGDSGWIPISGQGTIDTMGLVNLSQTISSGAIPTLTYDVVRFNITSVQVEYLGKNYSARIGAETLTVPIVGGLKVNSTSPAAALVDIQPTVLNLGSDSNPSFTIAAGAKALQVPSGEINDSLKQVGHTLSLQGHTWFSSFRAEHSESLSSTGPTLTNHSFTFSVTNTGADAITIRMVLISPSPPASAESSALSSIANGAIFAVGTDGSLTPLSGPPGQVASFFGEGGYSLAAGSTHEFSYSGTISGLVGSHQITAGTSYYVVIVGSDAIAVQSVTAS
jgi:Domain of unknown function (DUF4382)